jgi:hypothetical protein
MVTKTQFYELMEFVKEVKNYDPDDSETGEMVDYSSSKHTTKQCNKETSQNLPSDMLCIDCTNLQQLNS